MLQNTRHFSGDWFSKHLPLFKRYVAPLAGTPCRLLEIGCYEGCASCWLLDNVVRHPDAGLVALDIYEQPALRGNIATCASSAQFELVVGLSRETLKTLQPPASFDFVYVDACHGTIDVLEDAVLAFRLLKVGGVIAFDDYKWANRGTADEGRPKEAIDAFRKVYKRKLYLLSKGYQLWVRKLAE